VLQATGRYSEARATAEDALARAEEAGDRWVTADAYTVLGDIADMEGRGAEAEKLYHEAMSAALASDNARVVVRVAIGLLWVGGASGQSVDDAQRWYAHGTAALERLGGQPELSAQLHNALAAALLSQDAHEDAEEHMRIALQLRTAAFGADHPSLNSTWTNLGRLYASQGRYDEALAAFERAHALTEQEYGMQHPQVARTLDNLGSVHGQRKEYDKARERLELALAIQEASLGSEHVLNAGTLVLLATALRHQGKLAGARTYAERARSIYLRTGELSVDLARAELTLGKILEASGEDDAAATTYESALAIATEVLGEDSDALTQFKEAAGS
jgi:tetratricopeptide (TPR) repeat protein